MRDALDTDALEREVKSEYEFVSERAANACRKYGVQSRSLGARKPD